MEGLSFLWELLKTAVNFIQGRRKVTFDINQFQWHKEIVIYNRSEKVLSIDHWEVVWRRQVRKFPRKFEYDILELRDPETSKYLRIEGKDRKVLKFSEPDFYALNLQPIRKSRKGQKLFMELYFNGSEKPVRYFLYEPYYPEN